MFSRPDNRIPCPGMIWREPDPSGREGIWRTVRKAMLLFVDGWGPATADLSWSTEALFGIHRLAGAAETD